jgi:predicted MPP superfamily phosphohydrolase
MKKIIALLCVLILFIPVTSFPISGERTSIGDIMQASPGEIIAVSCSEPYLTLSEPVSLIVTLEGEAGQRFNETITVTDEFSGFVSTNGDMRWISGNLTVSNIDTTIGKLPKYTKRITWYPSVVGNHTLSFTAGTSAEKRLNVSVSYDVEGIIAPSLGCPSIILKNNTDQLQVTVSEERTTPDEPAQILEVVLQDIHTATVFLLNNQTAIWSTWLETGVNILEDDLVTSYDVDSIPDGFYNISVTTTQTTYTWPHAVQILQSEPTDYTIVQLSDVHIGKYFNYKNLQQELIRLFTYLDEHIQPSFIILSGDSVDWYNQRSPKNAYVYLQEALLTSHTPVYITPGNHERYGNRLLLLYYPFKNLTSYHRFLNPLSDYSLTYGDVNYVFLDSGYEYSRWEIQPQIWNTTPEGSGLTTTQIYLLENIWGNDHLDQIIIMHHPAVNNKNDTLLGKVPNDLPGGNDECIAFNRAAFLTYCVEHNVSLVLTGHTHENHVYTTLGKEPVDPSAWPLFIQTTSSTLSGQDNGGFIVDIKNSSVISYKYLAFQ